MPDQFCYLPTGETRPPKRGEWYHSFVGIVECRADQPPLEKDYSDAFPIYRRVPYAVVLGLVEACDKTLVGITENFSDVDLVTSDTLVGEWRDLLAPALAAAREAGIAKEPTP